MYVQKSFLAELCMYKNRNYDVFYELCMYKNRNYDVFYELCMYKNHF